MGILGSLILVFLVVHLRNYFYETHFTDHVANAKDANGNPDLFALVKTSFEMPVYVALYVFSMGVLGYHLLHGFQSAFRSIGIMHKKYTPIIEWTGKAFAIVVPVLFAAMPLYFMVKKLLQ